MRWSLLFLCGIIVGCTALPKKAATPQAIAPVQLGDININNLVTFLPRKATITFEIKKQSSLHDSISLVAVNKTWTKTAYVAFSAAARNTWEIRLIDWASGKDEAIIGADMANRFLGHPTALNWVHPDTLVAIIANGSSGYIKLNLNVTKLTTISESDVLPLDKATSIVLSAAQLKQLNELATIYPAYKPDALADMIKNTWYPVTDNLYLGQISYAGYDNDIRLWDLKEKTNKRVLSFAGLPGFNKSLKAVTVIGKNVVFAITKKQRTVGLYQIDLMGNNLCNISEGSEANLEGITWLKKGEYTGLLTAYSQLGAINVLYRTQYAWYTVSDTDFKNIYFHQNNPECVVLKKAAGKWFIGKGAYLINIPEK